MLDFHKKICILSLAILLICISQKKIKNRNGESTGFTHITHCTVRRHTSWKKNNWKMGVSGIPYGSGGRPSRTTPIGNPKKKQGEVLCFSKRIKHTKKALNVCFSNGKSAAAK